MKINIYGLVIILILFLFTGCSGDLSQILHVPKNPVVKGSLNTSMKKKWDIDLKRELEEFNRNTDETIKSIKNHKSYLAKTYNVNYYDFENGYGNGTLEKENIEVIDIEKEKEKKKKKEKKKLVKEPSKENVPQDYDNQLLSEYEF